MAAQTGASSLSASGLAFLTTEEGVRRTVYNDSTGKPISSYAQATGKDGAAKGYPTVGLGLALLDEGLRSRYAKFLAAPAGRPMTDAELSASIDEVIRPRTKMLNSLLTVPVTQNQWDALFSFAFNRGFKGHNFPSAIAETNAGNPSGAAKYIAEAAGYETVPHIQARRLREAALYSGSATAIAAAKGAQAAAKTVESPISWAVAAGLIGLWAARHKGWI